MAKIDVTVDLVDDSFHFVGTNGQGLTVDMDDASERPDGVGLGVSPMQLLLMGLGGCSGIDLASILRKSRVQLDRLQIQVEGRKPDGVAPSLFSDIHVRFLVDGDVTPERVERAVSLSLGKYCSVARTLEPTASITAEYVVNGVVHRWKQ